MDYEKLAEAVLEQLKRMDKARKDDAIQFNHSDYVRVVSLALQSVDSQRKTDIVKLKEALDDAVSILENQYDWDCEKMERDSCQYSGSGGTVRMCKIHRAQSNISVPK